MSEQDQGRADAVRVEVTLPAPFDEVWKWVRDPTLIRRWHGWDDDGLDDEIRFMFVDRARPDEAARTLGIGNHLFSFESRGADTVVRLTRAAPALDQEWTEEYYGMVEHGWTVFLEQLRFALAHHPDDDRRTVFLYGRRLAPTTTVYELGLANVAAIAPGERYTAVLPTGDELAGEVWFVTDHELGLTIDGWGDGLLVVATEEDDPAGARSMAVMTTYGMGDADLEGLQQRWAHWWSLHHTTEELASS